VTLSTSCCSVTTFPPTCCPLLQAMHAVIDAALADRNDVKVGDTLLIGPTSEPVEGRKDCR
jgi:putative ABC transport system permease protein